MTIKELLGAIAVVLTILGYIPYIRDTLKGKTTPHVYTWFLWSLVSYIAFALQISDKAGPGAYLTFTAATVTLIISILGLRQGKRDITFSDTVFLILALIALVLWLFAKQPTASIILVSIVDVLAFVPTIRKSWKKPQEETLSSYATNTVRFAIGIAALERYTLVSSLYPFIWLVANGLFSLYLVIRRQQVQKTIEEPAQ